MARRGVAPLWPQSTRTIDNFFSTSTSHSLPLPLSLRRLTEVGGTATFLLFHLAVSQSVRQVSKSGQVTKCMKYQNGSRRLMVPILEYIGEVTVVVAAVDQAMYYILRVSLSTSERQLRRISKYASGNQVARSLDGWLCINWQRGISNNSKTGNQSISLTCTDLNTKETIASDRQRMNSLTITNDRWCT